MLFVCLTFVFVGAQGLLSIKHYSSRDGLSQNMVQSVLQDADGFIWMATWNGLEKFDGYSFTNYKSYPTDKVRLKHNRLLCAAVGGKHTLLCQSYDHSLYVFDTQKECFEDIYVGNPEVKRCQNAVEMCSVGNGIVWVLSETNELWRIDCEHYAEKGGITYFDHFVRTGDVGYFEALSDDAGHEWVLTDKGYFVYGNPSIRGNVGIIQAVKAGGKLFFINEEKRLMTYSDTDQAMCDVELPERLGAVNWLLLLDGGHLGIISQRGFTVYGPEKGNTVSCFIDEAQEILHPITAFQDSKGDIWLQSGRKHVVHIDVASGRFSYIDYLHVKGKNVPCFMLEDEHGGIWAYPPDGVLSYYHPDKHVFEQGCVVNNAIKEVYNGVNKNYYIDNHKNVWLCQDSGIDCIMFSDWNFDYIHTLDRSVVRGLYIDRSERLWVADKGNVVQVYDKERVYCGNLSPDGKLVKDHSVKFGENVYAFFEDNKGNLWMGTRENGLFIGMPDGRGKYRFKHYKQGQNSGLNCNAVYQIAQDASGRMWIATYGGGLNLAEGDPDDLRFINVENLLRRNYPGKEYLRVRTVCPLSNGVILVGTTGGLISFSSRFDQPGQIRFYVNRCETIRENSLSDNDVMDILETSGKEVYIAMFSGGISKVLSSDLLSENVAFSHYNRKNGLPSDFVLSMTEDSSHRLWVVLENKICRFFPLGVGFEVYDYFNQNSNLVFTEAAPCIDSEGKMYVGCNEGALCLQLDQLKKSLYVPNLVFVEADIRSDKGISQTVMIANDTLLLDKDERNVTVSFAAIDFMRPSHIQYAYRIKDMGEGWTGLGENRSVSFANLPAGKLALEVKSTNGDGVWTDNVRVLYINVEPKFWETGWAVLLYVLLFFLLLAFAAGIVTYIWGLRKKIGFEQEMTNMKLRFFTDISHELRTPLTLIEAPIEEVLRHETLSPEGQANMRIARHNTERMLALINQILDFRKIQNNKMKLYIEQVNAVELLRKIYDDFLAMASAMEIDFRYVVKEKELNVFTDVDKLEKIVINLLSNAFKYTPKGKGITLSAEGQDNRFVIKVKDEGQGIDIGKISKLFERFETAGSKRASFSTGIGLSLVHELVDLLHGTVDVSAELGKGSEFTVSLPAEDKVYRNDKGAEFILNDCALQAKELAGEEECAEDDAQDKSVTILLVEDNEELRKFTGRVLRHEYRVLEAENGRTGLDMALKEIPDIIISDVMMPEMDGIELLDIIKHNPSVCHIPVVVLSAKASLEDRIKGLEYGADGYITKPFSSAYLLARIKSLMRQKENLKNFLLAGKKLSDGLSPSLPKITRFDEEFIRGVLQKVEENLENPEFKIDDLADFMKMGRTMFYRKLKSILGCTPIDLVKDMRVKRAVQLLEMSEYTVSEVAYMCGFSSPQYFSRVFKSAKGCTPTKYKEKMVQEEKAGGHDR